MNFLVDNWKMLKTADKKFLKRFGEHIKELRKQRQLSLRQLSWACNIDHSKIAKIEKGEINLTFTTLIELARGLETHPMKLMDFEFDS